MPHPATPSPPAPEPADGPERTLIAAVHEILAEWRAFRTSASSRGDDVQIALDTIGQRLTRLEKATEAFRESHLELSNRMQSVEILVSSIRGPARGYPPTPAELIEACGGEGRKEIVVDALGRRVTREFDAPCDPDAKWRDICNSVREDET